MNNKNGIASIAQDFVNFLNAQSVEVDGNFSLKSVTEYQNNVKTFIRELDAQLIELSEKLKKVDSSLGKIIVASDIITFLNILFYQNSISGLFIGICVVNSILSRFLRLYNKAQASFILDNYNELKIINGDRISALDDLKDYIRDKKLDEKQIKRIVNTIYPVYKNEIDVILHELSFEYHQDLMITDSTGNLIVATNNFDTFDKNEISDNDIEEFFIKAEFEEEQKTKKLKKKKKHAR